MKKSQLTSNIDEILEKYQFYKSGSVWNRGHPDFIDVIDLQISKSKEDFTINVGVADKFVIQACWGMDGSSMVEEPSCTVRARLGELLYGRDVWWGLSDDDGIEEALSGIQDAAIPFLQLNHSIDHMIETLESDPASRRYPPGGIYLALLHHRKGEGDRCREILKSMKLTGAWSQKASDILAALN
jgi:hypothetical protein